MALKDYIVREEEIQFPGGSFTVKALTLGSILLIVRDRMDFVKELYNKAEVTGLVANPTAAGVTAFFIDSAPDILGDIIAHAAGEPAMSERAKALPASCQIEALNKIVALTFEASGGVKKFAESVVELMEKANSTMAETNDILSKNGSKDFIGSAQS